MCINARSLLALVILLIGIAPLLLSHRSVATQTFPLFSDEPVDCVKPSTLVDRWEDSVGNSVYDEGELYDPLLTGWVAPEDTGTQMTIVPLGEAPIQAQRYVVTTLPPLGNEIQPINTEEAFRAAMSECSPYPVAAGDSVLLAGWGPGATEEEVQALIDRDPSAFWDEKSGSVKGSAFSVSPRLIRISFYDPANWILRPGRSDVIVSKIGVLFLESASAGGAIGVRFVSHDPSVTPVVRNTWGGLKARY